MTRRCFRCSARCGRRRRLRSTGPRNASPLPTSSPRRCRAASCSSSAFAVAAPDVVACAVRTQLYVVDARHAPMVHPGSRVSHPRSAVVIEPSSGVGVFAALAAGVLSFLSPCVLPLVPGYLSAVSGIKPSEIEEASLRRVLVPALLFVASFSAIFIVLGLGATKLGSALNDHRETLERA